jgi:hypothetical protein
MSDGWPPALVAEEFDLGEHTVRKGVGVLVKGLWWFPWPELGGEVVVERRQRVVREEPGADPCSPPCGVGPVDASSGHRSVSHRSSGQSVIAASISRRACSKLLAMLCTNGFVTPYVITHIDESGGAAAYP